MTETDSIQPNPTHRGTAQPPISLRSCASPTARSLHKKKIQRDDQLRTYGLQNDLLRALNIFLQYRLYTLTSVHDRSGQRAIAVPTIVGWQRTQTMCTCRCRVATSGRHGVEIELDHVHIDSGGSCRRSFAAATESFNARRHPWRDEVVPKEVSSHLPSPQIHRTDM